MWIVGIVFYRGGIGVNGLGRDGFRVGVDSSPKRSTPRSEWDSLVTIEVPLTLCSFRLSAEDAGVSFVEP